MIDEHTSKATTNITLIQLSTEIIYINIKQKWLQNTTLSDPVSDFEGFRVYSSPPHLTHIVWLAYQYISNLTI